MFPPIDAPIIENAHMLETHARRFIDTFHERAGLSVHSTAKIIIRNGTGHPDDEDAAMRPPVVLCYPNGTPVLYLRADPLVGQPASVLEGGMALELAGGVFQQRSAGFHLNFEREILPIFSVSGSAVQFIRRLVMHLETGLKRFAATRSVIDNGYGTHLFYYCYHTFQPSEEDRRHYGELLSHHWMRAMYLARKNTDRMPLMPLDGMGTPSGLRELWKACHSYLVPEDHQLLVELAETPLRMAGQPFAAHTKAMLKKIMDRFLS
jgi:hypothetical protein